MVRSWGGGGIAKDTKLRQEGPWFSKSAGRTYAPRGLSSLRAGWVVETGPPGPRKPRSAPLFSWGRGPCSLAEDKRPGGGGLGPLVSTHRLRGPHCGLGCLALGGAGDAPHPSPARMLGAWSSCVLGAAPASQIRGSRSCASRRLLAGGGGVGASRGERQTPLPGEEPRLAPGSPRPILSLLPAVGRWRRGSHRAVGIRGGGPRGAGGASPELCGRPLGRHLEARESPFTSMVLRPMPLSKDAGGPYSPPPV